MKTKLNLKPLAWALVGAGVTAAGTSSALDLKPSWWPGSQTAATASAVTGAAAAAVVPIAPIAAVSAPDYRAIVAQAGPAVVGITVAGTHKAGNDDDEDSGASSGPQAKMDPNDPFFQFFRGIPGFGQRGGPPQGKVPFRGQGSGFIVSADGLILTNAHVVREAKDVTVKLNDRREYSAKVLGMDPATDIAVLRIEAKNLPVVKLGDSKLLQVGDPVLAIGAPYGFEQSATSGIVSAKGRSLPGDAGASVVPFIQTDAAVNPGNSGGPLFDGAGSVVGINAQIYSQSGGFQGLSFAIPIDVAMRVKDQIVATGHAQHARIGVVVQDVNQALAQSFGLERPDGALVSRVAADSPAAKAGLKAGDVITKVDGDAIERSGSLSSHIGMLSPGQSVTLEVWRDKAPRELTVKLADADKMAKAEQAADSSEAADSPRLGLSMRPLSQAERREAQVDQGLVVEQAQGAAARAGIEQGDVLLAINGKPVSTVEQVKSVLASKPKSIALLVQRGGEQIFVPVNLG